jgi:hypothetical protein
MGLPLPRNAPDFPAELRTRGSGSSHDAPDAYPKPGRMSRIFEDYFILILRCYDNYLMYRFIILPCYPAPMLVPCASLVPHEKSVDIYHVIFHYYTY